MPLTPGARLGAYEVTAEIGRGGMGEVYQARDTKLDRDVALKVLPDAFTSDPDRLARFEREAKVLASLNHPNIGHIYGLEEAEGTKALVLELVEGPTLADRIAEGPIPLDEALPIAKQIAEALEAAHEQGIIHRDLKPANVKVKADGTVKVLDFGLAKAFQPEASGASASESPTISLTAAATQMGMVIGTAAYMSPEQAKGKVVDKRADVWSFGCVLYEMLTGRRAFVGDDVSDTLAAVLRAEVDLDALPEETPARLHQVLRVCLQRDPKRRVHDVADVRLSMDGAFEPAIRAPAEQTVGTPLRVWQRSIPAAVLGLLLLVLGVAVGRLYRSDQVSSKEVMRFAVTVPATEQLSIGDNAGVAVSPDGRFLAYLSDPRNTVEPKKLMLRSMDDVTPTTLATGNPLFSPFFSPSGEWVGIYDFNERELRRVSVRGGSALKIADVAGTLRGASWGGDDTIVFATEEGLWRVAASGGVPEQLTTADATQGERGHYWPALLPGGQEVLFTVVATPIEESQIAVLSLTSGERKTLVRGGSYPRYVSTGHLLYGRQETLWAVRFDPNGLEAIGDPVPVQEGVLTKVLGGAEFGTSDDGRLVYVPSAAVRANESTLVFVDRRGTTNEASLPLGSYLYPRISPDASRLAVQVGVGDDANLFIYEMTSERLRQLTFDGGTMPIWTPDGTQVTFLANDALWNVASDFSQEPQLLSAASAEFGIDGPYSWSPGGDVLFWAGQGGVTQLTLLEDGDVEHGPLLVEPYSERHANFFSRHAGPFGIYRAGTICLDRTGWCARSSHYSEDGQPRRGTWRPRIGWAGQGGVTRHTTATCTPATCKFLFGWRVALLFHGRDRHG